MKNIQDAVEEMTKGLAKKVRELAAERSKYKNGSPYEIFLGAIIQGIHYAQSFPYGAITMRADVEGKSKENDKIWKEFLCSNCNHVWNERVDRPGFKPPEECPRCHAGRSCIAVSVNEPKTKKEE